MRITSLPNTNLGLAEDKVNELHKTAKKQSEQLERQLREQGSLTQQILELQHQVTLIRQSSAPPVQEQNATAIDMSHVMKEMQSLREWIGFDEASSISVISCGSANDSRCIISSIPHSTASQLRVGLSMCRVC